MFREKDLRSVTSDSSETLPANFRASAISTPSVTLRKVQSEGEGMQLNECDSITARNQAHVSSSLNMCEKNVYNEMLN